MDKSQAFRDDLAAQRMAIFGYAPAERGTDLTSHMHVGASGPITRPVRVGKLTGVASQPSPTAQSLFDSIAKQAEEHSNSMAEIYRNVSPSPLAPRRLREMLVNGGCYANLDDSNETPLPAWLQLEVTPATPAQRAARVSDLVTITVNVCDEPWESTRQRIVDDMLGIVSSDRPGIAAMTAKSVQPTPEPVLSIGGEQATAAEFAQALLAIRGKNAPVVKETPRGLMVVREIDHRCGLWQGL